MYIRINDLPEITIKPVLEEMSEQLKKVKKNELENQVKKKNVKFF